MVLKASKESLELPLRFLNESVTTCARIRQDQSHQLAWGLHNSAWGAYRIL